MRYVYAGIDSTYLLPLSRRQKSPVFHFLPLPGHELNKALGSAPRNYRREKACPIARIQLKADFALPSLAHGRLSYSSTLYGTYNLFIARLSP